MIWEKKKFIDFIQLQRGHDLTKEQFVSGPYPVVSSTSIMGYHKEYKAEAPGVVIGRSGTLGKAQYINENYWPHNTSLYVKDYKGNYPKFVYYFLCGFETNKHGGGSAVPTLNRNNLSSIDVKIPDYETQHRIAEILSTYDDLIENNQKRIKLLEEVAMRLYKEWFINLHFQGCENTTIVDGLPDGWSIIKLEEIYKKLETGSRPKGGIDKNLADGVVSIGAENVIGLGKYNYNNDKIVPKDFFAKMKRGILENKDILIYKDGAYIGKTTLFQDDFPHKNACVNEHVFLLHAKEEYMQYYLFLTLYQPIYFKKMQKLNKNAAQPGINQGSIKSLQIILPSENIIKKFDDIITPLFGKVFVLAKQAELLKIARNKLLPKLMSGEIEV